MDQFAVDEYIRKAGGAGRYYGQQDVEKLFTAFRGPANLNQFQAAIETRLARWQPLLGAVPTDEEAWSTVWLECHTSLYRILIEPPAYSAEARQALDALCKQVPATTDVQQPCTLWNVGDDHWMTITAKTPEQLVETYNALMGKILEHTNSKVPLDQLTLALPDRVRRPGE